MRSEADHFDAAIVGHLAHDGDDLRGSDIEADDQIAVVLSCHAVTYST
jgi:hypothetical protein